MKVVRLSDDRALHIACDSKNRVTVTLLVRTWEDGTIKQNVVSLETGIDYIEDSEWENLINVNSDEMILNKIAV